MRVTQSLLLALLAAQLGLVAVLDRRAAGTSAADSGEAAALERYGLYLRETAVAAGMETSHEVPRFDPQLDHIMPQIASMGAGVSVADFDRDGWQDVYATNSRTGSLNRLYRNRGDGTFEEVAEALGVADVNRVGTGVSMGSVWGDYDGDGFEDLFVYKYGRPELLRNVGGLRFERATAKVGLPDWVNANGAVWLDYDCDGYLDLFVAGYFSESVNLWELETTHIMPESFEFAENGGRNYLLRNRGDGTFEDVTEVMGISGRRWTLAVAAADLFATGYPDLVLANDYGISEVYANQGGIGFEEVGRVTGIGYTPKSGMNVAFGDVFNQGRFSIYETNISEEGILLQGNNLWVPSVTASGTAIEFENLAGALGVDLGGWSWGAQFGDLNNDGGLDLFLTNGYVSADRTASYWYDFAKVATGHASIISDAKNWPAMNGRSLSGYQQKRVWLNDGAGRFNEVAQAVGVTHTDDGRAVALVDLWNRGVLDVLTANQGGALRVYENAHPATGDWIAFELEGTRSNRSAIGARVRLTWNGRQQVQEVSGGSGFAAQNQRRLHFGLGEQRVVDEVQIRWPSGRRQTLTAPAPGVLHQIVEPR